MAAHPRATIPAELSSSDEAAILDAVDEAIAELPESCDVACGLLEDLEATLPKHAQLAIGRVRYARARTLVELGRAGDALQTIDDAVAAFTAAGAALDRARTALGRMHVLDDLGRHDEAILEGEALLVFLADTDPDTDHHRWLVAAALENTGVAHGLVGDHEAALDCYGRAGAAYEALDSPSDIARLGANSGVELLELGRVREAQTALREARARFVALGDELWSAKAQTYLGHAAFLNGSYAVADTELEQAAATLERQGAETELARARHLQGMVALSEGDVPRAHTAFERAASSFEAAGASHDLGRSTFGLGLAHLAAGDETRAQEYFDRAAELFGFVGDLPMLARVWLAAAELSEDPRAGVEAAIALLETLDRPADLAFAHLRGARLAPAAASDHVAHAVRLARNADSPHLDWVAAECKRIAAEANGDRRAARRHAEHAASIIITLAGSLPPDASAMVVVADRSQPIRSLVGYLLDDGEVQRALELGDRLRPLHRRRSPSSGAGSRASAHAVYSEMLVSPAGGLEALRRSAREHESIDAGTRAPVRAVAAVVFQAVAGGYRTVIRRDGELVAVPGTVSDAVLGSLLGRLSLQWERVALAGLGARHPSQLAATAADVLDQLEDLLWAPVHELLDTREAIVVIADQRAGMVPFHALASNRSRPMTVATSLSMVDDLARRRPRPGPLLVVGADDAAAPAASTEAQRVAQLAPGSTLFTGSEATIANLSTSLHRAGTLHIAAHGLHRPDSPQHSAIKLADGWLTAADLRDLDVRGRVVILSCCDTGRRDTSTRRGSATGLADALFAAGAHTAIVATRRADDVATAILMEHFHRALAALGEPASAMAVARTTMAATHPHPYHWAPFEVLGVPGSPEPRPVNQRQEARQ